MPRRKEYTIDPSKHEGDLRGHMEVLRDLIEDKVFLGFTGKLYSLTFSAAATNYRFQHQLTATPIDILITQATGGVTVTINWTTIDANYIDISVSGACTVRLIAGTFKEVS